MSDEICLYCKWSPCTHDDSSWCEDKCKRPDKLIKELQSRIQELEKQAMLDNDEAIAMTEENQKLRDRVKEISLRDRQIEVLREALENIKIYKTDFWMTTIGKEIGMEIDEALAQFKQMRGDK